MTGKRSLEGKMEARERDRERKRRDQLTLDQLEHVRSTVRNYRKNKRLNMTETEKQKARDTRNSKYEPRNLKKRRNKEHLKEIKNIEKVIRMRKLRSLLNEKEKNIEKLNSKVRMAFGRKNGFLKTYKQRKKRDQKDLYVWKDFFKNDICVDLFLETNSKKKHLKEKLTSVQRQIMDDINQRRTRADMLSRMRVWGGRSLHKTEQVCSKNSMKMRKHRVKIKEKIEIDEFKDMKSKYDSDDSDSDNDDQEDSSESDYY